MSEYQYYEFVALDAPLTAATQRWVRSLSTRAEVTSTRFVNTYEWGDFKGDPAEMLARGFDAHVYVSNFGCCRFILKLPKNSIDRTTAREFCRGAGARLIRKNQCDLVEFAWEIDSGDWDGTDDGSHWMGALVPNRASLLAGDYRALYLAWLRNVHLDFLDDDEREPPVPRGLKKRSGHLEALVQFLQINPDLISAAASPSDSLPLTRLSLSALRTRVRRLSDRERTEALVRLLADNRPDVRRNILNGLATDRSPAPRQTAPERPRRTIRELRFLWEQRAPER